MFNEAKMTYKNSVEKSELLLDSLYLGYEDDDPFQSVRDDDEDDQSVKIDQSVKERENSDSENSDHQEEDLTETFPPAESFTEVQPVGGNLTSPPADSSQSVRVDQAASHAVEDTLIAPANDDELSVLVSDPKPDDQPDDQANDQINDQTDNRLISDENNSLILNYSRSKIRHDYKQLHHRSFVKAAKKIGPIESIAGHGLVTLKTFEQAINGPQAKEWRDAMQMEYDDQVKRDTFIIITPPYDVKSITGKWVYKIKENSDESISRFKARWVTHGYRQIEGVDYEEKYVSVVRSDTSRILLSIAAILD
jgi:hypothetical protein